MYDDMPSDLKNALDRIDFELKTLKLLSDLEKIIVEEMKTHVDSDVFPKG